MVTEAADNDNNKIELSSIQRFRSHPVLITLNPEETQESNDNLDKINVTEPIQENIHIQE